jgi:DNA-binding NtrC family response regulator
MAHILVVDDDGDTREALDVMLQREGHTVTTVGSGSEALTALNAHDLDVVLCDVKMPEMDGLEVLRQVQGQYDGVAVVMMSGHNDVVAAVDAMKEGALDYLMKPLGKAEVLRAVQKALAMRALLVENLRLKRQVREHYARTQVIGSSPAWRRACALIEHVAPSRATVLLLGESGTGKELLAHILHDMSPRADGPFIALNTAALPVTLLEAELFGYEKGAFTGAHQRKLGQFELADGGTLFLDEIGDMPTEVQVKLLRVLQDGMFQRLGDTHSLKADVRVVAATHKDLAQEVGLGRFRQDLYYRLNVIMVRLPPLRERRTDIPLLAAHFLRKYAEANGKEVRAISHEAMQQLLHHAWPGNVRELENVLERAVVLAQETTIKAADLHLEELQTPLLFETENAIMLPATATLAQAEREMILQTLRRCHGNRQAASRQLDIGVSTLYRKLKEYQLS